MKKKRTAGKANPKHFEPTMFPVVGVGASAGGLDAFTSFLKHLPPKPDMAFVFITHLDPQYVSKLSEILPRATSLPVVEIGQKTPVRVNHLYVVPSSADAIFKEGSLRLTPRNTTQRIHLP